MYRCPAGETLKYHYTNVENGLTLHRYWTTACQRCPIKSRCTPAKERRITRWEHEAVQRRLDQNPRAMRLRRETVEHPFGTIKARMGATHFLMKTLPRIAGEMALHVLAYNLTRALNMMGSKPPPRGDQGVETAASRDQQRENLGAPDAASDAASPEERFIAFLHDQDASRTSSYPASVSFERAGLSAGPMS